MLSTLSSSVSTSATTIRLVLDARLRIGRESSECRDRLSSRSEFLDESPLVLEHRDGEILSGTIKPELLLIDMELDVEGGFWCTGTGIVVVEDGRVGSWR